MEPYDIGYAIGSMIPFVIMAGILTLVIYLIIKQSKAKKNEQFEDREN